MESNKQLLVLLWFLQLLISCRSNSLTPHFKIGMDEKAWRDTIISMRQNGLIKAENPKDSLSFWFKFNLGDTLMNTKIGINNDGIAKGKLRVITFDFTDTIGLIKPNPNSTDPNYPSPSEDSALADNSSWDEIFMGRNNEGRINFLSGSVLHLSGYEKVFTFLQKRFGPPDSVLDSKSHRIDTINYKMHKFSGEYKPKKAKGFDLDLIAVNPADQRRIDSIEAKTIDTSNFSYFFHDERSITILERSRFIGPNYFVPFIHTTKAILYQYSKRYDKELEQEQTTLMNGMRPSDLITIPLYYNIERKTAEYGRVLTYLMLRTNLDPDLRKTPAETREIESMKGKIIVNDKYGTLLQEFTDIEIQAHGSLPSISKPGLDYACGLLGGVRYNLYTYSLGIYVEHQNNSDAFKQAVAMGNALSIKFVPNAIMFTDGTILK